LHRDPHYATRSYSGSCGAPLARALSAQADRLLVASTATALIARKYFAAFAAAGVFGYDPEDVRVIEALTLPQVAATLAVVLVVYGTINAAGQLLINEKMLGSVLALMAPASALGPAWRGTLRRSPQCRLEVCRRLLATSGIR
jgi:hypothetical protein